MTAGDRVRYVGPTTDLAMLVAVGEGIRVPRGEGNVVGGPWSIDHLGVPVPSGVGPCDTWYQVRWSGEPAPGVWPMWAEHLEPIAK